MFKIIDRQPAERIPELLAACDAAFISFKDEPLFYKTIPAKLQSYMACGMPIIASASGETERIINAADCGICTEIGDVEELSKGIRRMMRKTPTQMGENSRKYFWEKFDKRILMDQMDKYFRG